MKRAALLVGLLAGLIAWTQNTNGDWLKGIIFAGSAKVQLTDATGKLIAAVASSGLTGVVPIGHGGTSGATAASGFANLSPLTTKGDVLGYSTTNARVPVGTDGLVLQADSTQSLGVKYGQVSLGTSAVTGVLAIANGGTNGASAASGLANLSPLTTKGDLLGFSTTNARVAVGANKSMLVSDSAQAAGVNWLPQVYAQFTLTANMSVANNTWSNVGWTNTLTADGASIVSIASNGAGTANTRIKVSTAGLYAVSVLTSWASNVTGVRAVDVEVNSNGTQGSGTAPASMIEYIPAPTGTSNSGSNIARMSALSANDYFEVFVLQTSGGSLNLLGTTSNTVFQITRIGM